VSDGHARVRRVERQPEDPARPRLFFAVPLPDEVREAIRPVRDDVQSAVGDGEARIRWVRVESLHLTLRFLGPTSLDEAPRLGASLDALAAGAPPFEVRLAGAGAFPAEGRPRTLWLGIEEGAAGLARLAAGLAPLTSTGDDGPVDDRPFSPHLTLARTDGLRLADEAARALVRRVDGHAWTFVADRVVLYRSHLGEGPAWYEPIHEARLTG
jgi:RNA 2',3'-cyclic 3'-phosphodiesterase